MVFRLSRILSRSRSVHIIPEVEQEPSHVTSWNNDVDAHDDDDEEDEEEDDSTQMEERALPQIVITESHFTDSVETKLTSSFDTQDVILETQEKVTGPCEVHETKVMNQDQPIKPGISLDSLVFNPSRDSTTATGMTSVSQSTVTMDVHECNSIVCTLCHGDSKNKNVIRFINVPPLDTNMINKLRTQPAKWYELGRSFDDLYREANRPDRRGRRKSAMLVEEEVVACDNPIS